MAAAAAILRRSGGGGLTWPRYQLSGGVGRRCFSSVAPATPTAPLLLPAPSPISPSPSSSLVLPAVRPQLVVPRLLPFAMGSMDLLMAVPKKKVSPYKKGLRNGPKALKPVPVIVRCTSCGRVKLPHFYCCSGDRGSGGKSESTN